MCIRFEWWRMNIQCLLRWKMKAGNISDFFVLGNYDFGTWDIHGALQKILLSCAGSALQADVNRKFTPSIWRVHTGTLYLGHTLCLGLPTPGSSAQAPEAAGWGGHPPGTVVIRNKAPGLWYLKCRWAIYTWSTLPLYGHHWRKNTRNRWKQKILG